MNLRRGRREVQKLCSDTLSLTNNTAGKDEKGDVGLCEEEGREGELRVR